MLLSTLATLAMAPALNLLPMPAKVTPGEGTFEIDAETRIVAQSELRPVAESFRQWVSPPTGAPLEITNRGGGNAIHLRLDAGLKRLGDEGYRLVVRPDRVEVHAAAPAGVFYGLQTFRQMLPASVFRKAGAGGGPWSAPCVEIEDQPRFRWRGMHLDVARHFMPKNFVLRFIDLLAAHKMNTLHWHLTDDQGWRIEIRRYPKLTAIGAWRTDTMRTYDPKTYWGMPHGGFYTQEDIREVVAYAKARFVNVVPEIEMPGHAQAAIAAYPELGNTGKQLQVATGFGVIDDVFNVEDSTIQFLQNVLAEVIELFPSPFIHIGGDECPKTQWKASAKAQAKRTALGLKDEHELQSWFIKQMDAFLDSRGRRLIGWDEILEGGLAEGATVMSWRGMQGGIDSAKAGHDVVMTPTSHTYFDYYQSKNTKAEPHAIGGFLPLETVYAFEPVPESLTPEEARRVLGAQGQLWSEYIPTPRHAEYMAFPRACALAEVTWSPKEARDWASFEARLRAHLERLTALDVNFRKLGP